MIVRLKKGVEKLTNYLQTSYDKTKKGLHVDILTPEPLANEIIYYQGWKQIWNIGSIQSQGKYVVGEDKEKEFIKNGKWYWKVDKNEEIKTKLAKFFFSLGKQRVKKLPKSARENLSQLTFSNSTVKQIKQIIQARIISLNKTCLADLSKVFYWNSRSQKRGYFLLNTYQKRVDLDVGATKTILLVQGTKHNFFNRLL